MAPLSVISTLLALCSVEPLTVAVTAVRGNAPKSDAVGRLLDRVPVLPFDVAALLIDRGFYDGASVMELREAAPVVLPVICRGEQIAEKLATSISH